MIATFSQLDAAEFSMPTSADLVQLCLGGTDAPDIFTRLLTDIVRAAGADYGRLVLSIAPQESKLLIRCVAGAVIPPRHEAWWIEERALRTDRTAYVIAEPPLPYFTDALHLPAPVQLLAAPIAQDDIGIGAISLGFVEATALTTEELGHFGMFARSLGAHLPAVTPLTFAEERCPDISGDGKCFAEQLKSAELEGISHTIATINHEIANPLVVLMATVQLLRLELPDGSPSIEKKFARIGKCCTRIQEIIEMLSQVSQPARRVYAADENMLDLHRATSHSDETSTHPT
jgi:signal transduction histidine kinase